MDRSNAQRRRNRQFENRLVWGLLAAFLAAALFTAYLTFIYFRSLAVTQAPEPLPLADPEAHAGSAARAQAHSGRHLGVDAARQQGP